MSSDKTEEPTPRRLRKAREQGDVPVSGALNQAAGLAAAVVLIPSAAGVTVEMFQAGLRDALSGAAPSPWAVVQQVFAATLPVLGAAALAAASFGVAQTGGLVTFARLQPKLDQLNPAQGIKKLFSLERVTQVLRALLTALLLTWLCMTTLEREAPSLAATSGDVLKAAVASSTVTMRLLWLALGLTLVMGAVDVVVTRRAWLRRNRMSKDEVKREYKESEGDPQIKQARRRAHQEMLDNSSLLALKDANVVIVNPTHLATALRYDEDRDEAPTVVACGQGEFARQLVEAARAYGIPVVRDVPVARALRQLQSGDEIPEELYEAVAEILREVWGQTHPESADELP